ncbi:helix-turn-helix domain-containing protein [Tabrizicola oligotrophica]|uniref:Helix-turn-helix domain-containing protein n=1 Tax=Tabrizicola oligotrophica TaxID=2710650 RepID=A0A6M0QX46_9RHOB|nr:helix-turn-helix domain-containing protein [Tabrizicola oligotrophica]NEY92066.1 helix-turn-helix domain-containing protein [Tabrizicola oligotrophica]
MRFVLIADAEVPGNPAVGFRDALVRHWHRGGMVGAWGGGCVALVEAGMLAHRPDFVPAGQSFRDDGRVLTSIGKAMVSDLVRHLIRLRCGQQVMIGAMDHCLIRRTPDDGRAGFGHPAARPAPIAPRIATLDRWIEDNISRRFKACDLAPTVGLSVRQLERLFLRHLDRTPAEHLEHKRLSLALTLMRQTNLGVDGIARSTGHRCLATFRRKFRRKFGTSPVLT